MRIEVNGQDTALTPDVREDVVCIGREAIVNAAHADAHLVAVSLEASNTGVVLRVRDDGAGIGSAAQRVEEFGFGLRSMRERAASHSGRLMAWQPCEGGTELEVVLP